MPKKVTSKILENAHKMTYLVKSYPEHTVEDLLGLLALPGIDKNVAIWKAVQEGYISEPDPETQKITLLKEPEAYQFGEAVEELKDVVMYAFRRLAKKETDLDEQVLGIWLQGYAPHDCLIALKSLEAEDKLSQYALEDGDSTYTFFTLSENKDKMWGRKQFKQDPLPDENTEEAEVEDKDSQDE